LHAFIGLLEAVGSSSTDFTTDTAIAKIGTGFTATTTAGSQFPGANWQMILGYHSAPTLIDLGAGFALTIGDFLEVILYAATNDSQVSYTVNNLTSGATVNGVLNVNLPLPTTFLGPYAQTCLQTIVSGTLSFDVSLMYLEMFDG